MSEVSETINKLFICNIAFDTNEDELQLMFEATAEVISFKIISEPNKKYGFVFTKTMDDCLLLIEKFDGFLLNGRSLVVRLCNKKRQQHKHKHKHCKTCTCSTNNKYHPYDVQNEHDTKNEAFRLLQSIPHYGQQIQSHPNTPHIPIYHHINMQQNPEQISTYQNQQMPTYQNQYMPIYQNQHIPTYQNQQIPRYQNQQIPRYQNQQQTPRYQNQQQTPRYQNQQQIHEYSEQTPTYQRISAYQTHRPNHEQQMSSNKTQD